MNYRGMIIEESLGDISVLGQVEIIETKIEPVTPDHKTPWVSQWTLHTVELPYEYADKLADEISKSFDPQHPHWYADFKNDEHHYIVYSVKVFKVDLSDPKLYKDAREYGIRIGIPEYQVDFASDDQVWER